MADLLMSDRIQNLRKCIIDKLKNRDLPELAEESFIKNQGYIYQFQRARRSRLEYGTMTLLGQNSDGPQTKDVVVKVIKEIYASQVHNAKSTEECDGFIKKLSAYYEREVEIWITAAEVHKNVARIIGFLPTFENEIFPALVMPNYERKDLRTFIENDISSERKDENKIKLLHDVAVGLAFVHGKGIVHREIQGSNILVDIENGIAVARINNFGSAKLSDPALNQVINSTRNASCAWQPPEYLERPKYTNPEPSFDMWSFGCTILEVLTGHDPWNGISNYEELLKNHKKPPIPNELETSIPPTYKDIIEVMPDLIRIKPKRRLTAEHAVERLVKMVSVKCT